jgi:hypothetical protein|nr:MAG TPA: hypothetical protein [Caudoviricetes sp.]
MSTTQHTGHYNLPTFGDNPDDRPSWRGDFTDAMTEIDNQMYANATNITTATAAANNANTAAGEAKQAADDAAALAQTNKNDIAELDDYFSKLGVTSPTTAQNLMNTINGKAEDTELSALRGTVSGLTNRVEGKADASSVYTRNQVDTTFTKQGGYSGTAQQIHTEATNATATATNVQEELTNLKTSGQSATALVQRINALTNHFSNVSWTAYYSPLSKFVNIMVRFGSPDGRSNANCTSNVNPGSLTIGTMPEGYRPNGFINSYPFTYGNDSGLCNISITGDGVVSFYCQGTIKTNTQLKQTLQLSYFVI